MRLASAIHWRSHDLACHQQRDRCGCGWSAPHHRRSGAGGTERWFLAFFSIGFGLLTMVWFMDFNRPWAAFVIVPLMIVGAGASIALMQRRIAVEGERS